uniref:PorP/SprF family type IX secretion system membrane protein n=1 Tax=Aquimarina rhodophyticola TaxID=3342246 RepID=UPI00406BBC93
MIKKLFLVSICCISLQLAKGQEESATIYGKLPSDIPTHNLVRYNRFYFNPTFSLVRETKKSINIYNRIQWSSFNDNPQTFLINYTSNFDEKTGVSIGLHQQNEGVYRYFGGVANYAYNLEFGRDMNFTFGLNLGFSQSAIKSNLDAATIDDGFTQNNGLQVNDPLILNYEKSSVFLLSPGVNFNYEQFDVGVAVGNLVAYNITASEVITDNMGFTGHVMYTHSLERRSDKLIRGMVYANMLAEADLRYGGNAILELPSLGWAQAGYNSFYGASVGVGANITPNVSVGYSYETGFGDTSNFGATHEVTLAYNFQEDRRRKTSRSRRATSDKAFQARDSEIKRLKKEILQQNKLIRELQEGGGSTREITEAERAMTRLERSIEENKEEEARKARELELQREEEVELLNRRAEEEERLARQSRLERETAEEEERLARQSRLERETAEQEEQERLASRSKLESEMTQQEIEDEQIAKEEAAREAEAAKQEAEAEAIAARQRLERETAEQQNETERAATQRRLEREVAEQKAEEERIATQRRLEREVAEQKAEEERVATQRRLEREVAEQKAEEERIATQRRLEREVAEQKAEEERIATQRRLEREVAEQKAEEERVAAQRKLEREVAEQKRIEEEAEAARLAEEARQREAAEAAEAARLAEEARQREAAEAARLAEEARQREAAEAAEAARLAEEARQREAAEAAEAARLAEEARQREAAEAAEAARLAEEEEEVPEDIKEIKQELDNNSRITRKLLARQDSLLSTSTTVDKKDFNKLLESLVSMNNDADEAKRDVDPTSSKRLVAKNKFIKFAETSRPEAQFATKYIPGYQEGYYLIGNVFKGGEYAEKFKEGLNAIGFDDAQIILNPENDLQYVSIASFRTKEEASEKYFSNMDNKFFGEMWVLQIAKSRVASFKRLLQETRTIQETVQDDTVLSETLSYIGGHNVKNGYYLITNIFKRENYFERGMEKLRSQGLEPQYFRNPKDNYIYVYLKRYDNLDDAKQGLFSNVGNKYDGDLYILRIQ